MSATQAFLKTQPKPAAEPMVAVPLHLLEELLHSKDVLEHLARRQAEEASAEAPEDDEPHIGFGRKLRDNADTGPSKMGFKFH
ncbi:MAG: hypothetical protein GC136_10220 [Alphaproteobacteria bacterium]|nr:hypothetical protein [Alphaproteobacteria bacterium]